jgi:exonuclease VII small subunit
VEATSKIRKNMTKPEKKIKKVMREFKRGELPIGKSKKKVKSRKQAIAIALSEAGKSKPRR